MWIYMGIEGYICSETNRIKSFMITSILWFFSVIQHQGHKCSWFKNIARKPGEEADHSFKSDNISQRLQSNAIQIVLTHFLFQYFRRQAENLVFSVITCFIIFWCSDSKKVDHIVNGRIPILCAPKQSNPYLLVSSSKVIPIIWLGGKYPSFRIYRFFFFICCHYPFLQSLLKETEFF